MSYNDGLYQKVGDKLYQLTPVDPGDTKPDPTYLQRARGNVITLLAMAGTLVIAGYVWEIPLVDLFQQPDSRIETTR